MGQPLQICRGQTHLLGKLDAFTFCRLIHMLKARHGSNWGQLRRQLTAATGRWHIAADGAGFFRIEAVTVTRYAYRGNKIPAPWPTCEPRLTAETVESPLPRDRYGGFGERPGKRADGNAGTAPRADSTG